MTVKDELLDYYRFRVNSVERELRLLREENEDLRNRIKELLNNRKNEETK